MNKPTLFYRFIQLCIVIAAIAFVGWYGYCAWDETIPASSDILSNSQNDIQSNFNAINVVFGNVLDDGEALTANIVELNYIDGITATPASLSSPTFTGTVTIPILNAAVWVSSEAQGDILYYSGSAWTRLANGTSGQYLKTQGASANPVWANPAEGELSAASVDQATLKTTMSSVNTQASEHLTLPGGEYGFYPQTKVSTAIQSVTAQIASAGTHTSYTTLIYLSTSGGATAYAQQRYVTASGRDHWVFLLYDKVKNQIISGWEAPDHPSYGQGGDESEIPHPFANYWNKPLPPNLEIILLDNDGIDELKSKRTRNKCLLEVIREECEIDFDSKPKYKGRDVIELDNYGDIPGEVLKTFKDGKTIKKRRIKTLPNYIKYRSLKEK